MKKPKTFERYYDIVASICNETSRTDSHLICGGFKSSEEAVDYINTHNISEEDYYKYCRHCLNSINQELHQYL